MERRYDEVKQAVIAKGYAFYQDELCLNFIWERTNDEITNVFSDFLHVCWVENDIARILTIPATTKPGLKGSILEPVTVEGITGTAIIIPGQYIDTWEFHDTDKEFSQYPYFRQVAPVNYWRDGDKDTHIDEVNEQDNKIFGTHWHRMSQTGTYGSGQVNNWSLGCMGAPEPEWKKVLPIVRRYVEIFGTKATGTLIETKDI